MKITAFSAFILLLNCFDEGFSSLYPTEPILWTDTKTSIKSGESEILLKLQFVKPCENFFDPSIVNGTQEYFTEWCNAELDKNVIKPLEDLCRPVYAEHRRKKRFIRKAFRGVVNAGRSIFGIFSPPQDPAIGHLQTAVNRLSIDIFSIKAAIAAGEKRQEEFEKKLQEYQEALAVLDEKVKENKADIDSLKEWKNLLIKQLGTTMTLVSKLAAYFQLSKSQLNQIAREWKEGQLDLSLFDVFMMGDNYPLVDMYKGAKPIECFFDARDNVIDFRFLKNDTDFGIHVLKANPFTLYQQIAGSYLGYRLDYVGPSQVAYDALSDCLVPFSGTATEILMFPGDKECLPMNDLSVYKYWKKSCFPMYYNDETAIQFKAMGDSYYIYCYGFTISIYKNEVVCPNYVFSVHTNETIRILNGKSEARRMKPEDFQPADNYYSTKVVRHLMPQILKLNFESFNLSQNCPYAADIEIVEQFRSLSKASFSIYITLGIIILCLVGIIIGNIFYVKRRMSRLMGTYGLRQPKPFPAIELGPSRREEDELENLYSNVK